MAQLRGDKAPNFTLQDQKENASPINRTGEAKGVLVIET